MQPLENVLLLFVAYYLSAAPFTKVEESFNIQAIHDLIYNEGTDDFDHLLFPGVVPRTFTGAWLIASLCKLVRRAVPGMDKPTMQVVARGILGLFNYAALVSFKRAVSDVYGTKRGRQIGNWFILLVLGQFHMLFYLSRPLPNMFALPLVLTGYRYVLKSHYLDSLRLLAFTAIVFRSELVILCAALASVLWYHKKCTLLRAVLHGAQGAMLGLGCSLLIDSKYWRVFPMVPEIYGVIFNVLEGKSSEWGTEPFLAYLNTHLPNLMGGSPLPLVLGLYAMLVTPRNLQFLAQACAGYVLVYSLQPHKELRFIIYVTPVFTALAARGIDYLYYTQARKSVVVKLLYVLMIILTAVSVAASLVKLHVSSENYPGGYAIQWFNTHARPNTTVHLDVLGCMTGITRFQYSEQFTYDKTEGPQLSGLWSEFDYYIGSVGATVPGHWRLLHTIDAFSGLRPRAALALVKDKHRMVELLAGIFRGWNHAKSGLKGVWDDIVGLEPAIGIYERA